MVAGDVGRQLVGYWLPDQLSDVEDEIGLRLVRICLGAHLADTDADGVVESPVLLGVAEMEDRTDDPPSSRRVRAQKMPLEGRPVLRPEERGAYPLFRGSTTRTRRSSIDTTREHKGVPLVCAGLDVVAVHADARRAEETLCFGFVEGGHLHEPECRHDPFFRCYPLDELAGRLMIRASIEVQDLDRRRCGHRLRVAC
jgi:hypothetical protein